MKHLWAPTTILGMLNRDVCFWWVMINFEHIRFFLVRNSTSKFLRNFDFHFCLNFPFGQLCNRKIINFPVFLGSKVDNWSHYKNFAKQLRFREKKSVKKCSVLANGTFLSHKLIVKNIFMLSIPTVDDLGAVVVFSSLFSLLFLIKSS